MQRLGTSRRSGAGIPIAAALAGAAILAGGCGDDPTAPVAWLVVTVHTTGGGFDPDGYVLFVDGDDRFRRLEPVDTLRFQTRSRDIDLELAEVARNCSILDGAQRAVSLVPGVGSDVGFEIVCTPPAELATLRLVFEHDNGFGGSDLVEMRADGEDRTPITTDGRSSDPAVSSDGSRIAFVYRTPDSDTDWWSELRIMARDGSEVIDIPDEWIVSSPTLSPDGSRVAYTYGDGWWWGEIRIRDVDGGDPMVVPSPGMDRSPAWSPDGSRIAFTRLTNESAAVYSVAPDGGDPLWLADGGLSPVWSPTADRIAFQHGPNAKWVTGDSEAPAILVAGDAETSWEPTGWSGDGEWIVLTRWHRERSDIYVLHSDDRKLLRVTGEGRSRAAVPVAESGAPVPDGRP